MNKVTGLIGVVVVAAGAYFGGNALGLFGGDSPMSEEDFATAMSARAAEINADGGVEYDDTSSLGRAVHVEKQLTIYGDSTLNMADIPEDYMATREALSASMLCSNETLTKVLADGATFKYFWNSADGESIGGYTIRDLPDPYCSANGF